MKILDIIKNVYKVWELELDKEAYEKVSEKVFEKLDDDKNGKLTVKDLILIVYEYYKTKKGK